MKIKGFIQTGVILVSILFLGSCATFKSEIKGKYASDAEKSYGSERVRVLFVFSHYRQTKGWDAIPQLDDKWQRIRGFDDFFNDALSELSNIENYMTYTEYASDVNEPERRALRDSLMNSHDFIVKMKFSREKSFAGHFLGTLFSSVSLTLLPVPYFNSYKVRTDIYDSERRLIASYQRTARLTKWVQTGLIFVYPFHTGKRKKEELYVEFMHDIFRQIESEGMLTKS